MVNRAWSFNMALVAKFLIPRKNKQSIMLEYLEPFFATKDDPKNYQSTPYLPFSLSTEIFMRLSSSPFETCWKPKLNWQFLASWRKKQ